MGKHILPSTWLVILSYMDSHLSRHVIKTICWSQCSDVALKENLSLSTFAGGFATLVHNLGGGFCYGVSYSGPIDGICGLFQVLFACLEWCILGTYRSIFV